MKTTRVKALLCACTCFLTAFYGAGTATAQDEVEIECINLEGATDRSILAQASVGDEYRKAHQLATGAGVKVAVIDTGVAQHPRLGTVEDGGNLVDDGLDAFFDCDAHGTIVGSVIAARDTGDGIVGLAPGATIISVRQSSSLVSQTSGIAGGSLQTLIDALHVALDKGAQVINVSVVSCIAPTSGSVDTHGLHAVLSRAEELGTVIVSAAGNESSECPHGSTVYPAHHDTVIGVAAYSDPATITSYSISSPWAQLSAPGYVATALSPDAHGLASGTTQNGNTIEFSGTSFAAPFVSGTVALMKQRSPHASAADIRRVLFQSADPHTGAIDPAVAVSMIAEATPQAHPVSLAPPKTQVQPSARNTVLMLAAVAIFLLFLTITAGRRKHVT